MSALILKDRSKNQLQTFQINEHLLIRTVLKVAQQECRTTSKTAESATPLASLVRDRGESRPIPSHQHDLIAIVARDCRFGRT